MTVLQMFIAFKLQLAFFPVSRAKDKEGRCKTISNSELRTMITDGSVQINGERWTYTEEAPPYVYSIVLWPNSSRHRTTLL